MSSKTRHWLLSSARLIHSHPQIPHYNIHYNIILPFTSRSHNWLLSFMVSGYICIYYASHSSHILCFYAITNINSKYTYVDEHYILRYNLLEPVWVHWRFGEPYSLHLEVSKSKRNNNKPQTIIRCLLIVLFFLNLLVLKMEKTVFRNVSEPSWGYMMLHIRNSDKFLSKISFMLCQFLNTIHIKENRTNYGKTVHFKITVTHRTVQQVTSSASILFALHSSWCRYVSSSYTKLSARTRDNRSYWIAHERYIETKASAQWRPLYRLLKCWLRTFQYLGDSSAIRTGKVNFLKSRKPMRFKLRALW